MLQFSPFLLLIPYGIFVLIIGFLAIVNIGHLLRTGTATMMSFGATALFFFYCLFIISTTFNLLAGFDWGQQFAIDGSMFNWSQISF